MNYVFTIMWLTFHEARQRRILHIILVMGALFLLLFTLGFYFATQRSTFRIVGEQAEVANFLLLSGLYAANFLGLVLAVVLSADTISGEVESGAIHTMVTKPLRRWQIVLGKWLGLAVLVSLVIAVITGCMVFVAWGISGYCPPHVLQGIALMILSALTLLTVSILAGTRLNTLANGVIVFMLYALAFVAGWMEQIGAILHSDIAVYLGIAVSLLVPSEAMWMRASYLLQPGFLRELGFSLFATATAPSLAMVLYTLMYIVGLLLLAMRLFQTRDL